MRRMVPPPTSDPVADIAAADLERRQNDEAERRYFDELQARQLRARLGDKGVTDAIDELIDALVPVASKLAATIRTAGNASPEQVEQAGKMGQTLRVLHAARVVHEEPAEEDLRGLTTAELRRKARK